MHVVFENGLRFQKAKVGVIGLDGNLTRYFNIF